ncbi:MAG: PAS domain S-box protein [Anaerolineae bacterium]
MSDTQFETPQTEQERIAELERLLQQRTDERDRACERLQRHETQHHVLQDNHYRVLFDMSQLAKLLIDPDTGDILDANLTACQFYGYDKNTLTRMKITDINRADADELRQEMQHARDAQRTIFNFEHQLANGEVREVEVFSGPVEINGKTLLYSIIHDVTERNARQRETDLLWHAINQSSSSVVITDKDGNIEYVNPYFTEVTGYTLAEVRGKNPRFLKSGYTSPEEYAHLWQSITSGKEWSGQMHNKRKDGSMYWEHAHISPVQNAEGEILYFLAIKDDITERKEMASRLEASEARFRTLVNSMDDIVFTLDTEGRHSGVFGRWLEKNDLMPDMFLGKTPAEILDEEAGKEHRRAYERALQGERVVYEWSTDGQTIQTVLSPMRDNDETTIGIVGIGRDITQLKQAEAQLRESERFAHATVNALSAQIAIIDAEGNIISVNTAWQRFAEANDANLEAIGVGVNYLDVLGKVDPHSLDAPIAQAVKAGIQQVIDGERAIFSLEYACPTPDEPLWFMVRVTRFDVDEPVRVAIAHENITERVLAEQKLATYNTGLKQLVKERTAQLQRINNRMTSILDHISTPVLLVQRNGRIDITNPAFDRKMGYERDALVNEALWQIVDPADQAMIEETIVNLQSQPLAQPINARLITSEGETFDAEMMLVSTPDSDGYIVCTLYDITHLKEVERIKDEFISMVNHELRTPITSIALSSGILQQYYDRLDENQKHQKIDQIARQAKTLTELVTSILDMTRLDNRRHALSESEVDIAKALHDVVEELADDINRKGHTVHYNIHNSTLTFKGEHFDMVRIWRNLLSNAIKYTPDQGTITLELCGANCEQALPDLSAFNGHMPDDINSGRYIIGMVSDNGPGIDNKDLSQLFTRFYRGWATTTNIIGTGLGLSLVRDLIRLYGGDIVVTSQIGIGSTFCFWLPVNDSEEPKAHGTHPISR